MTMYDSTNFKPISGDVGLVGTIVQNVRPQIYDWAINYCKIKSPSRPISGINDTMTNLYKLFKSIDSSYSKHVSKERIIPGLTLLQPKTMEEAIQHFKYKVERKLACDNAFEAVSFRELGFTMSADVSIKKLDKIFPREMSLDELVAYEPSSDEISEAKIIYKQQQEHVKEGFQHFFRVYQIMEQAISYLVSSEEFSQLDITTETVNLKETQDSARKIIKKNLLNALKHVSSNNN
jgi:hypothetical protein